MVENNELPESLQVASFLEKAAEFLKSCNSKKELSDHMRKIAEELLATAEKIGHVNRYSQIPLECIVTEEIGGETVMDVLATVERMGELNNGGEDDDSFHDLTI